MSNFPYQLQGGMAVIRLDAPPLNCLGLQVRRSLAEAIDAALANPEVSALILYGTDEVFSAGADLGEFGSADMTREPSLPTLVERLEGSPKPTIAAIGDLCMGGGFELALGCHFRVARRRTKVALPEIKLGLLPGAGGTQRLPRAIGVEPALNLMLSGQPVAVDSLRETGLVDVVTEDDLLDSALAFAKETVTRKRPLRRLRDEHVVTPEVDLYLKFVRNALAPKASQGLAPLRCVDAVEAACTQRFEDGIATEKALFRALLDTPESRALRHAFFAERACAKVPGLPKDTTVRSVERVGVVGAGTMGSGIAIVFLDAGMSVALLEQSDEALARGVDNITRHYETLATKGRLGDAQASACLARLRPTLDDTALRDADLIVEAIFEDVAAKTAMLRRLDGVARPGAILASNTSTLDLNALAAATSRPADVIGLHFFSPANVMKLLEVVRGEHTAPDVLATAMALARRIRKTAVVSGVCDGFIGNRMLNQYLRIAGFLVDAGATPWQVDRALEQWGMAMGPFRMSDMAGNDIGWAIRKRMAIEQPQLRFSGIADVLCEQGRFGQKAGKGWYRYQEGQRKPLRDPEVDALIRDYRSQSGFVARRIEDSEVVERCIFALINEGARILDEGIALRASDIDVVYLSGYGFPRWRGGPMQVADEFGLHRVVRRMRDFAADAQDDAAFWTPAPLLDRLSAAGGQFNQPGAAQ
ncbi:3-hydroxyacyl-CoA dehydrogenase NAD-binding domain-containing protein [Paraburkholderia sp. J63]|uniref:3-hydroxyacyl-CoA dehydrogenase NAD-binding domain-containing protein n=1 Tax=Paraburkholderia sp. J63 TaxID=2805434 RepID=UPI002ABDA4EA|nr:3-hydroxyacyl-CoA dehydrogenase NAD-binding domain-containing protein [Paraburkholderia sp. J63]